MRISLAALFPLLLIAGSSWANSDGYIGWQEIQFKVGNGWEVHVAQADGDYSAGISLLAISHRGTPVEVPVSVTNQIRAPHLNDVKLLSRCCGDEVVLEIPVLEATHNGALARRTWSIVIAGDKFQSATLSAPEKDPESGF